MPEATHSVVWTQPALSSLLEIVRYIQRDKPEAALQFAKQVETKVGNLAHFPLAGRVVPEFSFSSLRELIFGNYRIIYWLIRSKRRIEVLAVLHGSRQLPK